MTPYNIVFGQLPHCETNIVDILINDHYDQEELANTSAFNTSASNILVSNTSASNTSASNTSAFNTSAILETNNNNELYNDLSNILDIYYSQDNNDLIELNNDIVNLQEIIIISDSETCELELLGTPDYSDLDVVLLNKTLSLRQASLKQNYTLAAQPSSSKQVNQEINESLNLS
ncbi:7163_t:CDS:2, partial [Dentiscutata erythropus]